MQKKKMVRKDLVLNTAENEETKLLCNLTTLEMYERETNSKVRNSYIAGFLYDPQNKKELSFEERQRKLKDVLSNDYSEEKICKINNIPHYMWKKLLEEHDIDSFKLLKKSPLIKEVYEVEGYENRRERMVDLLLAFNNLTEAAEHYKVIEEVIWKYCIIFRINVDLIYDEKFKSTRYKNKNTKKTERLVKGMEIPNEILEQVKENEEKAAAEHAENTAEVVEETSKEDNAVGANIKGGKKNKKTAAEVQENQYTKEEWFEKIKQIRTILETMFSEDYIMDSQITLELDFNKEYKIIKGIFVEKHPECAEAFTRKRLENFLRTNYGDQNILRTEGKDGENLVGFKHLVNILAAFRKFEAKFYVDLPLDEEGGDLEDAVLEFCSFSNMVTYEQLMRICKRFYGNEFHKVRENTDKETNLAVKKYIQNYLKLFKYPELTKEEEETAMENQNEETADAEDTDTEMEESAPEEVSVDKKTEQDVMNNVDKIQETQSGHTCQCGGNCQCKKSKPFIVKSKADIKKLMGTLEIMLETGSEFELVITNAAIE